MNKKSRANGESFLFFSVEQNLLFLEFTAFNEHFTILMRKELLHPSDLNKAFFPPSGSLGILTFSVVISGGYSTVIVIAAEADSPMPLSAVQR